MYLALWGDFFFSLSPLSLILPAAFCVAYICALLPLEFCASYASILSFVRHFVSKSGTHCPLAAIVQTIYDMSPDTITMTTDERNAHLNSLSKHAVITNKTEIFHTN